MRNYEDRKVSINQEVVTEVRDKLNDFKREIANYSVNEVKTEELFRLLQRLYTLGGNLLAEFDEFIACQKGCNQCCDKLVYITELEGMMIDEFIMNNFNQDEINEIQSEVNKRIRLRNSTDASKSYGEVIRSHKKEFSCIFYSQKNLCRVYPARPWNCRRHIVFSDRETCSLETEENPITLDNTSFTEVKDLVDDIEEEIYRLNDTFKNEIYYTLQGYAEEVICEIDKQEL
ncbi:YkgJ family cysteine cluster protein [Acetohalobium arabaticum]|uniref:Flagellin N-methylase n=1 Tax=Acetohalobium arabaticum (strain ATCC 49924 / DSM 5501 / Z-7288) TaxID=574087 RepID=D9QQD4_ACEAZ|nr:YkgJ family cysteine cluster protein [Acetohalobium arabaticum]ADL12725.1 hypothetical protein Acear_1205 [Acetohalobium arabaticum DSM 5501]